MADEIKTLSSQLAQDPDSLVFLRLGELLRLKGQFDAAHRVALTGLERHPHLDPGWNLSESYQSPERVGWRCRPLD